MLTETGRVVAIEGNAAWIETLRQSTCGGCAARSGCGHGMLNAARADASRGIVKALVPLDSNLALAIHDTVELELPESSFLMAVSMLYAVPLLSTLGAALLADRFLVADALSQGAADLKVTLGAALGLALGLLAVRWRTRRSADDPAFQPRVTGKI